MVDVKIERTESIKALFQEIRSLSGECNAKLVVCGQIFPVHTIVLATASQVFKRIFLRDISCYNMLRDYNVRVENGDTLVLGQGESSTWKQIIDFIYFDSIQITCDNQCLNLLTTANRFGITSLVDKITEYLGEAVDCCELLINTTTCSIEALRVKAIENVASKFQAIPFRDSFMKLGVNEIELILQHDKLMVRSELDVLHALMRRLIKAGLKVKPLGFHVDKGKFPILESIVNFGLQQQRLEDMINFEDGEVNRLTKHIRTHRLSRDEINEMRLICKVAELTDLSDKCEALFHEKRSDFESTSTPIPVSGRPLHARNTPLYTFQHPFVDVQHGCEKKIRSSCDPYYRFKWFMEVDIPNDENGRSYVLLRVGVKFDEAVDEELKDEEIGFQFFAENPVNGEVGEPSVCHNAKLRDLFEGENPRLEFMSVGNLNRSCVHAKTDSVNIGVTLYFKERSGRAAMPCTSTMSSLRLRE